MISAFKFILTATLMVTSLIPSHAQPTAENAAVPKYTVSEAAARKMVDRVLKVSPVIDGHNDLLIHYFDCKTCPRGLKDYPIHTQAKGHTDIPRWRKGGVGGQLLNVFGGDLTANTLLEAYDLVYSMESAHPNDLKVVGTAAEMRAAMAGGKIAILPTLENAARLQDKPSLLRSFYRMGLRSVTLAYKTNGLADGSDDEPKHNGLSPAGREMVAEMNRLGVLIDISHVSEKAMIDVLDLSKAPVIFSHSNAKALAAVNRNVSDNVLVKLKANRGIVMLTFVPYFVKMEHAKWLDAGDAVYKELGKKYAGDRAKMNPEMDKWEAENPQPVVTVADMADHFDHVKRLIGVDHIGMAGDFDGISFTIKGLEDVSTYPHLLTELARRGWTEAELRKITGENFLRVFGESEMAASQLRRRQ